MENYASVCRRRLTLWFPHGGYGVTRVGDTALRIEGPDVSARLLFFPSVCRWELHQGEARLRGSFDLLTKRLRQLLTSSEFVH